MSVQNAGILPNTRQILTASVLYGAADMLVLAVGGFLLLPLYTRQLTQAEFGAYVIVKTNIEILSFVLHFGLVSAVARVYFDYRKSGQHIDYLNSVVLLFGIILLTAVSLLALWGDRAWALLSPGVPASPYLWYCVAISAMAFAASLGSTWLRLEGRARAFTFLQVATAALLGAAAFINLKVLRLGLPGLLLALFASSMLSAAALPWLFGARFRLTLRWVHLRTSLHYALPIVAGLLAYFVLNRASTLILQRHVSVEQVAVFGLAQQLAMLVTIAGAAFGKAMQPAVFSADSTHAPDLMRRSARVLIVGMLCVTCLVLLFASNIVAVVAPPSYRDSHEILLILIVAAFVYSFSLISDTALLYHRRPKSSAAVSIAGAVLSASLGLWLIPQYGLHGAAIAVAVAFLAVTLLSHALAYRLTGHSYLRSMTLALGAACGVAAVAAWIERLDPPLAISIGIKIAVAGFLVATLLHFYVRKSSPTQSST